MEKWFSNLKNFDFNGISKLLFTTTDSLVMNCMEKLNVVTAFEFSEVTLEKLIFENRPQSSIVGNMINKQGDVRFFIAEMVETLSYLKEYSIL